MDSMINPFSPSAGAKPPELVGRDEILESARVLMGRTQLCRSGQSLLMLGLRGVGKTVLLNEILRRAIMMGNIMPIYMESSESKSLGEMLANPLRMALLKLNRIESAKAKAKIGLSALRNFMGTIRVTFGEVGIELDPLKGVADSGDRQFDLIELFTAVGEAAAEAKKAVVLLIDEVQYLSSEDLGALVMALHRMQQLQLPIVMIGAGLPILAKLMGEAKSYSERLFLYPQIGALSREEAAKAIVVPFKNAGFGINQDAVDEVFAMSKGYPYFIQAWGSQIWDFVDREPITLDDVSKVRASVIAILDDNFFRIRIERMTTAERRFLLSMARIANEAGECRIAEIAAEMKVAVSAVAPYRSSLIKKGMIYQSKLGSIAFTVPMFADYLIRHA